MKPHWPYMAPALYHAMYRSDQCLPMVRQESEWRNAHPVLAVYRQQEESVTFQCYDCIRTVRPAYQWLITDEAEQLFNLERDPQEFQDLGRDVGTAGVRDALQSRLPSFLARPRHRNTVSDESVRKATGAYKYEACSTASGSRIDLPEKLQRCGTVHTI